MDWIKTLNDRMFPAKGKKSSDSAAEGSIGFGGSPSILNGLGGGNATDVIHNQHERNRGIYNPGVLVKI